MNSDRITLLWIKRHFRERNIILYEFFFDCALTKHYYLASQDMTEISVVTRYDR